MMDNAFPIKKHNQQHLDLWPTHLCLFWLRRPFPHPLRLLHLGFNIIPIKFLPSLQQQFFTHTHTNCSSSSFIGTLSLIQRTACARAQFSGCSSTTNAHSETGQMAVCCQNLTLGAPNSCNAYSLLVGALFKKFGLFLNKPLISLLWARCKVSLTVCRQFKTTRLWTLRILTVCPPTSLNKAMTGNPFMLPPSLHHSPSPAR